MKYKRIVITRFGSPEVLALIEADLPEPLPGQVRVRILAAGVAYADVGMRLGTYPAQRTGPPPFSPGYDIVGIVEKLGAEVTTAALGERVAALTTIGGYAEYLCVPAAELVPVPAGVDSAEAVSLVLNYVTAYQMLHRVAEVKSSDTILVHGAAGGVGTAFLQLGKLAALAMIGTASGAKQTVVEKLGATPIDYQTGDWVDRVLALTKGGVNSVYDPIGADNFRKSYSALRPGGILVTYGNYVASQRGQADPQAVTASRATIDQLKQQGEAGRRVASYFIGGMKASHPDWFQSDLAALFDLLAQKKLSPVIAERLPLAEARRAHELLDRAAVSGKIVLIPDAP
jgi:NADPH:quinone reductase-like Zn-dependent oxidoreductase